MLLSTKIVHMVCKISKKNKKWSYLYLFIIICKDARTV